MAREVIEDSAFKTFTAHGPIAKNSMTGLIINWIVDTTDSIAYGATSGVLVESDSGRGSFEWTVEPENDHMIIFYDGIEQFVEEQFEENDTLKVTFKITHSGPLPEPLPGFKRSHMKIVETFMRKTTYKNIST